MQRLFLLCVLLVLACDPAAALQFQADRGAATLDEKAESSRAVRRTVQAARLAETAAIAIDGRLDEAAWQQAPVIDDLKQREPVQGAAPTERTVVRLLYDDEAIYVAARLYDSAPDSIVARLGRRDAYLESDLFGFLIDPFNDDRTGYYFALNAAGTLYDGVLMNDDWDDDSWDAVWQGKARIDEEGWVAEMRIPYSQLRFYDLEEQVWGINFKREIARKNEEDYLVYTPRNESGFVSRFYDLTGLHNITPPRQIEVVPYVTTKAEFTDAAEGDPFNDGSQITPDFGADLKYGVTNNLTLNATINPDFGQVEVDPAVVNLSDFETFFPEKRPFFIENANVFNFGSGGANNNWGFNWGSPDLFYSRRIGRAPQGSTPEADFVNADDGTNIIGAAKLTGQIGGSWNVGTVQALTAREMADLALGGDRFSAEVEPLAYYGVYRAQKEINEGRQALGFMSTIAARSFQEDRLRDEINEESYAAGLDGWTFLDKEKTWVLTGWSSLSHVRGTEARLLSLQQNSQHYFQRPDANHVSVDSSATSLTGWSGRLMLNKQRGKLHVNAALGAISPGFDVNDLGFQWKADHINGHIVVGYRWRDPGTFYRRIFLNSSFMQSYDFDGNLVDRGFWANYSMQFHNYWSIFFGGQFRPPSNNNRRTRGGPLTRDPASRVVFFGAESDSRKALVFELEGYVWKSTEAGNEGNVELEMEWRPAANVALSLSPGVSFSHVETQYVGTFDDPLATETFGQRYVFADMDQVTVSSSLRLNWTFSPALSFQLFAQPLISAGDFSEFKELARPKSYDFNVYGEGVSTFDPDAFVADPDGPNGPAAPLAVGNPDFNFASLRGTAVMRWEYRPGSTLFFVWTQSRSDAQEFGDLRFGDSFDRLIDLRPDNIFMVKFTYWLNP